MDHFGEPMGQPMGDIVISMSFEFYAPAQVMQPLTLASPSYMPMTILPAASPAISPAAPVRSRIPDGTAVSESSVALLAAGATSPSLAASAANATAANPSLWSSSTADSSEGGFVTLDAPTAGSLNSEASSLLSPDELPAGQVAAMEVISWPGPHGPTFAGKTSHRSENLAGSAPSRRSTMTLATVPRGEEGGSIELAIADPLPAAAGDNSPGDAMAIDATTAAAETGPQSGAGLFCDIEVAVAPGLSDGSQAALAPARHVTSTVVGLNVRRDVAGATLEAARPAEACAAMHLCGNGGASALAAGGGDLGLQERASAGGKGFPARATIPRSSPRPHSGEGQGVRHLNEGFELPACALGHNALVQEREWSPLTN